MRFNKTKDSTKSQLTVLGTEPHPGLATLSQYVLGVEGKQLKSQLTLLFLSLLTPCRALAEKPMA